MAKLIKTDIDLTEVTNPIINTEVSELTAQQAKFIILEYLNRNFSIQTNKDILTFLYEFDKEDGGKMQCIRTLIH